MLKILITALVVAFVTGFVVVNIQDRNMSISINVPEETEYIDAQNKILSDASNESGVGNVSEVSMSLVSKGETLDLSGQGLIETPSYVFDQSSIEELNLSNNHLDGALPAEVRYLQNLRVLNLGNNQFTGVPAEIGQLQNLEILDLSNNKLTGLPYELANLSNLKLLDLRGNNYSLLDLGIIKENLPPAVVIRID